jgi:hypothetical protein
MGSLGNWPNLHRVYMYKYYNIPGLVPRLVPRDTRHTKAEIGLSVS